MVRLDEGVQRQFRFGQRMVAPHHADVFGRVEQAVVQRGVGALRDDGGDRVREVADGQVGVALLDQAARVARRQRQRPDIGQRALLLDRRDERRQQHRGGGVGHRDVEGGGVAARVERAWRQRGLQLGQRGAHLGPQQLGTGGAPHAERGAVEQLFPHRHM